jgi:hypothetical protein
MSLTTLIAIWGAGLSTFLAFWKERPSAYIRYDHFSCAGLIDVSVENRTDSDVIVRGAQVLFCQGVKVIFGDSIEENLLVSWAGRAHCFGRAAVAPSRSTFREMCTDAVFTSRRFLGDGSAVWWR